MLPKSINEYIRFGMVFSIIRESEKEWPIHGEGTLLEYINEFLNNLVQLNLPVTWRAAIGLRQLRDELLETEHSSVLSESGASQLKAIMEQLLYTLDAEAQGNIAFIVTEKRLDVSKLLGDVSSLLSPGVFESLPTVAQRDFVETGRSIAFELPTSAAFHLMRCTEAVLRHFYFCYVKRNRIRNLLWGPIVAELRKCRTSPPTPLLDNLDNIRKSFRNPTQHPDKVYDIEEVQDLFGLCVDVINRMVTNDKWSSTQQEHTFRAQK